MFETASCGERKTRSSRLRRMDVNEFRAQARPSTVRHARLSDLHFKMRICQGGWTSGAVTTVEVEHVLETPSHPAAVGGELSLRRQEARTNVAGPASRLRSANAPTYSSPRTIVGAETATDMILLPRPTHTLNFGNCGGRSNIRPKRFQYATTISVAHGCAAVGSSRCH